MAGPVAATALCTQPHRSPTAVLHHLPRLQFLQRNTLMLTEQRTRSRRGDLHPVVYLPLTHTHTHTPNGTTDKKWGYSFTGQVPCVFPCVTGRKPQR